MNEMEKELYKIGFDNKEEPLAEVDIEERTFVLLDNENSLQWICESIIGIEAAREMNEGGLSPVIIFKGMVGTVGWYLLKSGWRLFYKGKMYKDKICRVYERIGE